MEDPLPLLQRIARFAPWTWKRRWVIFATLALLLFSATYMLSIGPLALLTSQRRFPESWFVTLYYPILYLVDGNQSVWDVIWQYQRWWLSLDDE